MPNLSAPTVTFVTDAVFHTMASGGARDRAGNQLLTSDELAVRAWATLAADVLGCAKATAVAQLLQRFHVGDAENWREGPMLSGGGASPSRGARQKLPALDGSPEGVFARGAFAAVFRTTLKVPPRALSDDDLAAVWRAIAAARAAQGGGGGGTVAQDGEMTGAGGVAGGDA